MNGDSLHDLLNRTDAAATPSAVVADDLAGRVRHIAKRRRRVRSAAAVGALVVLGLMTTILVWPKSPRHQAEIAQSAPDPVRLRAELTALRAEADARLAVVEIVLDREEKRQQTEKLRRVLNRPDALERVHREQDRAALILFCQADRIFKDPNRRQAAAAEYRELVELFPHSQWAAVARQRLQVIGI